MKLKITLIIGSILIYGAIGYDILTYEPPKPEIAEAISYEPKIGKCMIETSKASYRDDTIDICLLISYKDGIVVAKCIGPATVFSGTQRPIFMGKFWSDLTDWVIYPCPIHLNGVINV